MWGVSAINSLFLHELIQRVMHEASCYPLSAHLERLKSTLLDTPTVLIRPSHDGDVCVLQHEAARCEQLVLQIQIRPDQVVFRRWRADTRWPFIKASCPCFWLLLIISSKSYISLTWMYVLQTANKSHRLKSEAEYHRGFVSKRTAEYIYSPVRADSGALVAYCVFTCLTWQKQAN